MIMDPKKFYVGLGLFVSFIIFMIIIFLPVFKGQNGLEYMDALYNSISKGSANYIPELKEKIEPFNGKEIGIIIKMDTKAQAEYAAGLFERGGAVVETGEESLKIEGDLGGILKNCLKDSEMMYNNDGSKIMEKYNLDGKQVLYLWYKAFKAMDRGLNDQGRFKDADMVALVVEKAVECSYNYYDIEPKRISDSPGVVIFSLLFYVIYTVWYGFAFMYMFEGWGMRLAH